jgi:hypothetical protein
MYSETWDLDHRKSFFVYTPHNPRDTEGAIHLLLNRLRVPKSEMPDRPGRTEFFNIDYRFAIGAIKLSLNALGLRVNQLSWLPYFFRHIEPALVEVRGTDRELYRAYLSVAKPLLQYAGAYKSHVPEKNQNRTDAIKSFDDFLAIRGRFNDQIKVFIDSLEALKMKPIGSAIKERIDRDILAPGGGSYSSVEAAFTLLGVTKFHARPPKMPFFIPDSDDITRSFLMDFFEKNEPGFLR